MRAILPPAPVLRFQKSSGIFHDRSRTSAVETLDPLDGLTDALESLTVPPPSGRGGCAVSA
jgi:hypothetical protein